MEKPDMRIDALHNLAIELEHKAQYAVRRRMLRSEIDGEVAQRWLAHGGPPFGAPARQ
jgi:hypothetical protein